MPPLYKFLDVCGAKLTLGNRTFKHSKPSDFNDTEDLTVQGLFPDDLPVALKRIERNFIDVLLLHLDDPITYHSPERDALALIQQVFRSNPQAAEIVRGEMLKEDAEPIFDTPHMSRLAEETVRTINEKMQATRVLCVTTNLLSEIMWDEYAESHKGIALRIEPSAGKDSKFNRFHPVNYREKRPSLYDNTDEFIAGSLFGDFQERLEVMVEKIIYAKTLNWAHEDEYRLVIHLLPNEVPWNTDPYHPEEITELYLGLEMYSHNAQELANLARSVNPKIVISKMKRLPEGTLGFDRI